MALAQGKKEEALSKMTLAADLEDKTEKHPVTPCEVLPARELLGDMLLQLNQSDKAAEAYAADLEKHPNRFNGLYGAGLAAMRSGDKEKARVYLRQLPGITDTVDSDRPELATVRKVLRSL